MRRRIHLVAGARPNFMKVGPVFHALSATDWAEPILVHTGQHASADMSDVFLRDLGLPEPHIHLRASGHTHATQTASVMVAYEAACLDDRPEWVIVAGDVNSTLAACLAATKLHIPVAHLEAGLRSGDRRMPEELNRVLVDAVSDLLWTPSQDADDNLRREGVAPDRIVRVGNVMIDAYHLLQAPIDAARVPAGLGLDANPYVVITLHRPVNVDERDPLAAIVAQVLGVQREVPVVFPVHPRTDARLREHHLREDLAGAGVRLLSPLGYVDFMSLVKGSAAVMTDSGGVQEETSYLGIPCLTLRESTERPITITLGTNRLVGVAQLAAEAHAALSRPPVRTAIPLWDGQTAPRIVDSLRERLSATH
jgi:UDP-N-acetylglucosamine 2-epimerase (non-hydrolysing)